jgi:hypothetical protein
MTIRANKFTAKVLLAAPRRSPASPNSTGTLAVYTVSSWSFESHSKISEIRVLDINSGQSTVLSSSSKASGPVWLGDGDLVVWFDDVNMVVGDATKGQSRLGLRDR